jgi:hypothetical protein
MDGYPNRGRNLDRQAAFQFATGPALVNGVFRIHKGFRMGYKGGFGLGAIQSGHDVFPLLCGFCVAHETVSGYEFFMIPAHRASVFKSLPQRIHPLLKKVYHTQFKFAIIFIFNENERR